MSLLSIALLTVSGLLAANLVLAAGVRIGLAFRIRREARVRPRMRTAVANFAVEVSDELPSAFTSFERRLLREAMLEAAHELSGDARERLVRRFAEPGFVTQAERGLRSLIMLQRVRAAEIVGELGGLSSVPPLRRGLRDREPLVRFACAHALTRIGAEGILSDILSALAEGDDVLNQGALAEVLLDSGPDAVQELQALLLGPLEPRQRRLVVVVLGELRAFEAVDEVLRCLDDPDDELCARACHALGKIGDPSSAERLAAIATSGARPWFVRTAAAGACGQIGDPRIVGALVEALDSEEWYPRNAAAGSLVKLGEDGLQAICDGMDGLEPESVAHFWGMLDAANRTEAIIERAAVGERGLRRLVAVAQRAGATARLEELAQHDSATGRYAAATLGQGSERALDPVAV